VVTGPVTLRDVRLGPFRLELHVARLRDRHDVSVIRCVALEPNPAGTSEDTTHPHVRDEVLCAGDATVPLQTALRQGRVCDAFLLTSAVLHTYNPASPYVSLDDWAGVACADCGYASDPDSAYRCESCEETVCERCVGSCDGCDASYCQSCLERTDDDQRLCPGCRARCPRCERTVAAAEVEELGACRDCREQEEEEQRELERQEQEDHESDSAEQDVSVDRAAAAPAESAADATDDTDRSDTGSRGEGTGETAGRASRGDGSEEGMVAAAAAGGGEVC
jgi:hypothetical protein